MKPTDGYLHAPGAKSPRQIDGARKLIGLDADQANQAAPAAGGDLTGDSLRANSRVGLVYDRNLDFDIGAEDSSVPAVFRQSVHHGERIGGDRGAEPLNDISIVVVMRRFYQK